MNFSSSKHTLISECDYCSYWRKFHLQMNKRYYYDHYYVYLMPMYCPEEAQCLTVSSYSHFRKHIGLNMQWALVGLCTVDHKADDIRIQYLSKCGGSGRRVNHAGMRSFTHPDSSEDQALITRALTSAVFLCSASATRVCKSIYKNMLWFTKHVFGVCLTSFLFIFIFI